MPKSGVGVKSNTLDTTCEKVRLEIGNKILYTNSMNWFYIHKSITKTIRRTDTYGK